MSYGSIEALQEAFSTSTFRNRKDSRKAAGRALGTLVELITYYLLKDYGLLHNMCIERPLFEYANDEISHNVEFTLHSSRCLASCKFAATDSLTHNKIFQKIKLSFDSAYRKKSSNPYRSGLLKNAATLYESPFSIVNAYAECTTNELFVCELDLAPFAMFECKRVGVESGMKKGPQTIEKAKQGAYVSRSVSRLQRFRRLDGSMAGVIENKDGSIRVGDYDAMLEELIKTGNRDQLRDIVVTVGIISNHGNWFTDEIQNKETKVLSQSYDWLLFLTDNGLAQFIHDALLGDCEHLSDVRAAFDSCYGKDTETEKRSFTKSSLPAGADVQLTRYFEMHRQEIESWFNVLTPKGGSLSSLMSELKNLTAIQWEEVRF